MKILTVASFLFLFGSVSWAQVKREISPSVAEALCSGRFDLDAFWDGGIFDVQIQGSFLRSLTELKPKELEAKATELMNKLRYRGYAFGICPSVKSGWFIAFPGSIPGVLKDSQFEILNAVDCKGSIKGYWAAETVGSSRELVNRDGKFALPAGEKGFLGIECTATSERRLAQEFFLVPVGNPTRIAPYEQLLKGGKQGKEFSKVLEWIQKLRLATGLGISSGSRELNLVAGDLTKSGSVQHDPKALASWIEKLKKRNWHFVGENRVSAKTLDEAGFLLWASPRHRDLLLDASVTAFGIDLAKMKDGSFLVSIVGARK